MIMGGLWRFKGLRCRPEHWWAMIGIGWMPRQVGTALDIAARQALGLLWCAIFVHAANGVPLDRGLLESGIGAVNRCGDFWPAPSNAPRQVADERWLDTPAAWAVRGFSSELETLFAEVACGADWGCTLLEVLTAREASDAILDLLVQGIGSPFSPDPPTPGTARRRAAWRQFERARKPVLGALRRRGCPIGYLWG